MFSATDRGGKTEGEVPEAKFVESIYASFIELEAVKGEAHLKEEFDYGIFDSRD